MKHYPKIILLVAVALLLLLSACNRSASKAPVASPTPPAEAPFPYTTPDAMSAIKTQTAVALLPAAEPSNTPQVVIATVEATAKPETSTAPEETNPPAAESNSSSDQNDSGESFDIPEVTRPSTYTLQKGEWPLCIARRYDLDISSFLAANGMNMESRPGAGVVLTIPGSGNWSSNYGSRSLKSHPTTYTVASGDSIYSIACRYGDVAPEQILAANGLSNAGDISSGMTLKIP